MFTTSLCDHIIFVYPHISSSCRDVLDDQLWARSASNGWSSNWSWFWHACRPNSSIFPGIFFFFTFFSDHFPLHFLCNAVDKTAQDFQEKYGKKFWGLVRSLIFLVWWQIKLLGLKKLVSTIFEKGAQTITITITKQLVN